MSNANIDTTSLSQGLTVTQKVAIKNALLKIKLQENLDDIRFWGKVNGTSADYFIALSTSLSNTVTKRFYWSIDEGATFAALPPTDEFTIAMSPRIVGGRNRFSGNPGRKYPDLDAKPKLDEDGNVIEVNRDDNDEDEEEEEEEEQDEDEVDDDGVPIPRRAPPARRLTELDRLSYAVSDIESSTGIVPIGAYSLTATGIIQRNAHFAGLSLESSRALSSYGLLREPTQSETLATIRKMGVANHHQFLDTIVPKNSKIKNTWSLHLSDSGLNVSLRSLLYPGYEYGLEAGTNKYAGVYFGLGEKNGDLLFML